MENPCDDLSLIFTSILLDCVQRKKKKIPDAADPLNSTLLGCHYITFFFFLERIRQFS
ncbi:hypothetical protein VP424E501_P0018 [Vibrio phage 424E50-1]|nr:hypothetical protein VP424E501_P0018 [Vibrio phage 424E50-1]